eukprot:1002965-Rhodomonas_salina.1
MLRFSRAASFLSTGRFLLCGIFEGDPFGVDWEEELPELLPPPSGYVDLNIELICWKLVERPECKGRKFIQV